MDNKRDEMCLDCLLAEVKRRQSGQSRKAPKGPLPAANFDAWLSERLEDEAFQQAWEASEPLHEGIRELLDEVERLRAELAAQRTCYREAWECAAQEYDELGMEVSRLRLDLAAERQKREALEAELTTVHQSFDFAQKRVIVLENEIRSLAKQSVETFKDYQDAIRGKPIARDILLERVAALEAALAAATEALPDAGLLERAAGYARVLSCEDCSLKEIECTRLCMMDAAGLSDLALIVQEFAAVRIRAVQGEGQEAGSG